MTRLAGILVLLGAPAFAHRLDEYLQATLISVEKDHIQGFMRLVPGEAVSSTVIAMIDTNGRAYANRVLQDLSLKIDGNRLTPRLVSIDVPPTWKMKEGLGEIQLEFSADLPPGPRSRRLVFENHHESRIAAYLVNCLVPRDPNIRIVAQNRNETQSYYQLDFVQAGAPSDSLSLTWWPATREWLGTAAIFLFALAVRLRRKRRLGRQFGT